MANAVDVTITIPDAKVQRVVDAMKGLYPIPLDENGDPLFTDNQWSKEVLRRWIVAQVRRYEARVAMDEAAAAVQPDDTIAQ
jgi:hypothetical protein